MSNYVLFSPKLIGVQIVESRAPYYTLIKIIPLNMNVYDAPWSLKHSLNFL